MTEDHSRPIVKALNNMRAFRQHYVPALVVLLEIEAFWHALATAGIGSTYRHLFSSCAQLVELAF
jgi:hypothetical protein